MSDFGDLCCFVTPLDLVKPEDDFVSCKKFCIEVEASFMPAISDEDEDDESQLLYDMECDWEEKDFLVDRDKLLHDLETARLTIRDILVDMDIPARAFMIDQILACARQMENNNLHSARKVLHLKVRVDVPPRFDESFSDGDDDFLSFVPAAASAVENLETVKTGSESGSASSANSPCAVCFDQLLVGGEATRLPCSHVYHCECIRKWLQKSKFCPLCRFEVS